MKIDVTRQVSEDEVTVRIEMHHKSLQLYGGHALECIRQTTGATYCQNPCDFFEECPDDARLEYKNLVYPHMLEAWKREDTAEEICRVIHQRIAVVRAWVEEQKKIERAGILIERAFITVNTIDEDEVKHVNP